MHRIKNEGLNTTTRVVKKNGVPYYMEAGILTNADGDFVKEHRVYVRLDNESPRDHAVEKIIAYADRHGLLAKARVVQPHERLELYRNTKHIKQDNE